MVGGENVESTSLILPRIHNSRWNCQAVEEELILICTQLSCHTHPGYCTCLHDPILKASCDLSKNIYAAIYTASSAVAFFQPNFLSIRNNYPNPFQRIQKVSKSIDSQSGAKPLSISPYIYNYTRTTVSVCVLRYRAMEGGGFSRQGVEPIVEASEALFQKRRCCFFFQMNSSPSPAVGLAWWQKIRVSEIPVGDSLWSRGVNFLNKIRELSEIVAGPRWKTFIRRFNRNSYRSGSGKHVKVQYDALSYAMNFDEGPGQNCHLDEDGEDGYFSRNFSSRYAKGSMDLGKEGVTFV